MKLKNTWALLLVTAGIFFLDACKKENETVPSPVVTLTELGYDNSKSVVAGTDLHAEADIVAEGVIQTVKIEIHPEGGGNWEFDTTYSKFPGLKNATFHEHLEVPLSAEAGDYHFHLVVTDLEGNQTQAESELLIQPPADAIKPQPAVSSAPVSRPGYHHDETNIIH